MKMNASRYIINDNRLFKSDLWPSRFFFDTILFKKFLIVCVIRKTFKNNKIVYVFEHNESSEFPLIKILIY